MEVRQLIGYALSAFLVLDCQREPERVPTFQLKATTISVGEKPVVDFAAPLPKEGERYWITLVEATKPDSEWGPWLYVDDGVRQVALTAPTVAGRYEIRLHDRYPAQPYHVAARAALVVEAAPVLQPSSVRFELRSAELSEGDRPVVRFAALPKAGERYWITVIEAARPDSEYGDWQYVEAGVGEVTLVPVRGPGNYEARLHANYPDKPYNVVHRVRLRVR